MDPARLVTALKAHAASLGFDRLGITTADKPDDYPRYRAWIAKGFAADMGYLTEGERVRKRGDLSLLLPGAKSVVVGAVSYRPGDLRHPSDAKFGRYAWGADYHKVLRQMFRKLERWLAANTDLPFRSLAYVDTGPVLERSLARRAGVGWIGKNTCLLHESIGSYFVLGELITTLELPPDSPATDRCGSCRRCLDACPTGALVAPYELDSSRCIAYQTIENRASSIPEPVARKLDGWVAGCDICQEACPWNQKAPPARLPEFRPSPHTRLSLRDLREIDEERHRTLFGSSGLRRISARSFRRNASAASR